MGEMSTRNNENKSNQGGEIALPEVNEQEGKLSLRYEATIDDCDDMVDIINACVKAGDQIRFKEPIDRKVWEPELLRHLAESEKGERFFIVADRLGKVVGWIEWSKSENPGESVLNFIIVSPEERKMPEHTSEVLCTEGEKKAIKDWGADKKIISGVYEKNERARAFWKKRGFNEVGKPNKNGYINIEKALQ